MIVHLVDGTYELFRHFYGIPPAKNRDGEEIAAVRGVMYSIRGFVHGGATHIGVATDRVIESFRNDLWPGYKTGEGIDPALLAQFPLLGEVSDSADGFPGLAGWGAKSAATVLAKFGRVDAIPDDYAAWDLKVTRGASLAATLARDRELARLFPRAGDAAHRRARVRFGGRTGMGRSHVRAAGPAPAPRDPGLNGAPGRGSTPPRAPGSSAPPCARSDGRARA